LQPQGQRYSSTRIPRAWPTEKAERPGNASCKVWSARCNCRPNYRTLRFPRAMT
jgi:hypothetical protein